MLRIPDFKMDKPKKEPIILNQQNQQHRLCLNCGFPNRQADTTCMYCKSSLVEETGLIPWIRQTYYILRWRWQLKQKRQNLQTEKAEIGMMRNLGFFVLGVLLSAVGLYFFTHSITQSSFSNALIAILFLFYGFFTIKALFTKKQ